MNGTLLKGWAADLQKITATKLNPKSHGDIPRWEKALKLLPQCEKVYPVVKNGSIVFESSGKNEPERKIQTEKILREFHPWRKGPYTVDGIHIDTEWRSDLKWNRLCSHISPLKDKIVMDIGCGSGYHCFRMAIDGAKLVFGIDPYILSVMQFRAVNHFCVELPLFVVPLGVDDVPDSLHAFDTVFSMGLLYHRRDPIDHLEKIKKCLRSGGELVLETLIVEDDDEKILVPNGRYAKMRNVWNIPSPATLEIWLKKCGYKNIKLIDITKTTSHEQRSTDWMHYESLSDFLDIKDNTKTIEGWSAPLRALYIATAR